MQPDPNNTIVQKLYELDPNSREAHLAEKMQGIPPVNTAESKLLFTRAAIKTSELESTECKLQMDATNTFKT